MEDWVFNKIVDKNNIYGFGKKTQQTIKNMELKNGTTPKGKEARYIELLPAIAVSEYLINVTCSAVYTTVEFGENKQISSVKVWFQKENDELLVVKELKEEYDSSEKMWEFYNLIYKCDFEKVKTGSIMTEVRKHNNEQYIRNYKTIDGIKFGGEVDFNFSVSKVGYLNETVNNDPLFCDNKEKSEEEKLKNEILDLIEAASKHHHSVENVSMMASTGKMQITKQNIGNDRFDVFVYAIDEYCKGNTAWLLAHCTPENKAALCKFLEMICSKDGKLCSDEYYSKIYKITDKTLIDDLKRSGKLSIDSAQRVLEYVSLAYRVWIHRAKHYEKKYKTKYEELNGFSSEKLIEEYKAVVGAMQEL